MSCSFKFIIALLITITITSPLNIFSQNNLQITASLQHYNVLNKKKGNSLGSTLHQQHQDKNSFHVDEFSSKGGIG